MRSGTIGIPCDELFRYSASAISLSESLKNAPNWTSLFSRSNSVVKDCNHMVSVFEGDMLWFQADDHVWAGDTLNRLEQRGVDVIVPLILMRQQPFPPLIYEGENPDGSHIIMRDIPPDELIEVYAAGSGGMLVSREALDAIGPDPFRFTELESGLQLGEDLGLCARFRKAGIPIYCDTSVQMGHISSTVAWPEYTDEGWAVRLEFNSGAQVGSERESQAA